MKKKVLLITIGVLFALLFSIRIFLLSHQSQWHTGDSATDSQVQDIGTIDLDRIDVADDELNQNELTKQELLKDIISADNELHTEEGGTESLDEPICIEGLNLLGEEKIGSSQLGIIEYEEDMESLFSRIVLTVGEMPSKQVNISFASESETTEWMVRIGVKEGDMSFPIAYEEYSGDADTITTTLDDNTYTYNAIRVSIYNLSPSTEYIYMISDGNSYSYPRSFKTPSADSEATVAFFGDIQGYTQGQYDDFRKIYEEAFLTAGNIDLNLLAGDMVDSSNLYSEWLYLDRAVGDYLSTNLIAATPGNHDVKAGYEIYSSTFIAPDNGLGDYENRNYYFEIGEAIIAVLDTESPRTFDEQCQWLESVMLEKDDYFKIVLMHRSVYPISYDEAYVRVLANTFETCYIDLVLSGHDHIYSRTTMVDEMQVEVNQGVTYVVGGSASGSKYYSVGDDIDNRYWVDFVYDDNTPVFGIIKMDESSLIFSAYTMDDEGTHVMDSFELNK